MLLTDPNTLHKFFDRVIPDLKENECLLLLLAARKKYCPTLARSEEMLRREVTREKNWDKFLRKVKKLVHVDSLYVDKNGNPIPIDAFGAYIVLDPKDAIKAWIMLQKEMCDLMYQYVCGDKNALVQLKKVDVRWFSCLHRSKSRKLYWLVDIDEKNKEVLDEVLSVLDESVVWVSETRGGYHVIVRANERVAKLMFKESVFDRISEEFEVTIEIHKEPMTPLPGCLQGGFVVREVRI